MDLGLFSLSERLTSPRHWTNVLPRSEYHTWHRRAKRGTTCKLLIFRQTVDFLYLFGQNLQNNIASKSPSPFSGLPSERADRQVDKWSCCKGRKSNINRTCKNQLLERSFAMTPGKIACKTKQRKRKRRWSLTMLKAKAWEVRTSSDVDLVSWLPF